MTSINEGLDQKATLQAQLLVRDYGTSVVSQAKVGMRLTREDFVQLSDSSSQNSSEHQWRAAASASFLGLFSVSASAAKATGAQESTHYSSMLRDSRIRTEGGPSIFKIIASNSILCGLIQNLLILGDDLGRVDVEAVLGDVGRCQLEDGRWVCTLDSLPSH
jgi:hypothetical protein